MDQSKGLRVGNAWLAVFSAGIETVETYFVCMPAIANFKLAQRIAEEAAMLPEAKQTAVLDYVLFIKQQTGMEQTGDEVWEKLIADPRPRAKLQAYMKAAMEEGSEPLDTSRL